MANPPHSHDHATAPRKSAHGSANPVLVEVTRGPHVESRHRGAIAVVDPAGRVAMSVGNIDAPIYARSAIKPMQALVLLETGAADAFDLEDRHIAMACASHSSEPGHVDCVSDWLARIGCAEHDLECGPHRPRHVPSADALVRLGEAPTRLHNNCSGKHAGFLSSARHLKQNTKGYTKLQHPVQQRALGIFEQMTGLDLTSAPRGIDGCGAPQIAMPLGNIALAMARLANPDDQPDTRQAAVARIRGAMAAEPWYVAGTDRFDTRVIAATGGKVLAKTGAEGVYCGILPELDLGVCLKIDDGAGRAAETAMAGVLKRLGIIAGQLAADLSDLIQPPVLDTNGGAVGAIRFLDAVLD